MIILMPTSIFFRSLKQHYIQGFSAENALLCRWSLFIHPMHLESFTIHLQQKFRTSEFLLLSFSTEVGGSQKLITAPMA